MPYDPDPGLTFANNISHQNNAAAFKPSPRPDGSAPEWNCVGHNPAEWSCGVASVRRESDGWWRWDTGGRNGRSPSRVTAMEQAEREYAQNVGVDASSEAR